MLIIPVMDIQQGQVVHAQRGQRDCYQPIQSRLCRDANPASILQAFLEIYPFEIIYIADLDAIKGNGNNDSIIEEISALFPELVIWLDRGNSEMRQFTGNRCSSIKPVIGSETGVSPATLSKILSVHPEAVLSLDFQGAALTGDHRLLERPDTWPENTLIMSLHRTGTDLGPDIALLNKIKSSASGRKIFLAGGVRNHNDLMQLQTEGVAGVLIATALHSRRITHADITPFL
jgi:phosphoribosylformimino-5-aminoimidazole carboxamide ribotide isomerase